MEPESSAGVQVRSRTYDQIAMERRKEKRRVAARLVYARNKALGIKRVGPSYAELTDAQRARKVARERARRQRLGPIYLAQQRASYNSELARQAQLRFRLVHADELAARLLQAQELARAKHLAKNRPYGDRVANPKEYKRNWA